MKDHYTRAELLGCLGYRYRHWFTEYGLVGAYTANCVRCGAPRDKVLWAQKEKAKARRGVK